VVSPVASCRNGGNSLRSFVFLSKVNGAKIVNSFEITIIKGQQTASFYDSELFFYDSFMIESLCKDTTFCRHGIDSSDGHWHRTVGGLLGEPYQHTTLHKTAPTPG
jgi:hypothetical protein